MKRGIIISILMASLAFPAFAQQNQHNAAQFDEAPSLSPSRTEIETRTESRTAQDYLETITPADMWRDTLKSYTSKDGDLVRFDYAGLASSKIQMAQLDIYIASLAAKTPSKMNRNEALAYWANLYNALTIKTVAEHWPVRSIKRIGFRGPWKRKLITVEGRAMSLNDIEHGTMRAKYQEPRIHYMVNCASIGCPNLKQTLWDAQTLEDQMTEAAKAFINSPRGVSFKDDTLSVSSIFKWYKEDFGKTDTNIIDHLKRYADPQLKAKLETASKIRKDQYNWSINKK